MRLLPVAVRGKQLFGESGVAAAVDELGDPSNTSPQLSLFPENAPTVRGRARRGANSVGSANDEMDARHGATTLDRIHAAMLLQASGRAHALRNLLREEQERSPDFPAASQCINCALPSGQRRKAPAGRNVIGRAALTSHWEGYVLAIPIHDSAGLTVGWLDANTVRDRSGIHRAFVSNRSIFTYSGGYLGAFVDGFFRDKSGHAVAFIRGATGGPLLPLAALPPSPPLFPLAPLAPLPPLPPVPALPSLSWSVLDFEQYLAAET